MNNFDHVCPDGNIAKTLHPHSPMELEASAEYKPKCEFCNDTGSIEDWRMYIKSWRFARRQYGAEWMKTVPWQEVRETCKMIRDGWVGKLSGEKFHSEDCPACMYGSKLQGF